MTKKILLSVAVGLVACFLAFGQNGREAYSTSGAGAAAAVAIVPAGMGTPVAASFNYSVATAATITVYRPDIKTTSLKAVSGVTNLYIRVDDMATGQIQGYTLTTSDALIFPASGTSNAQLCGVAAIVTNGVTTNGYIYVELDATPVATAATNGLIFVAKAAKNVSIAVGTTASVGNQGAWVGFADCPVAISVPAAAGANVLSGVAEYW